MKALHDAEVPAFDPRLEASGSQTSGVKRKPAPDYHVGDKVWLSAKKVKSERPTKELDSEQLGPHTIVQNHNIPSYEPDIPTAMRIPNPVFRTSFLHPNPNSPLPNQHSRHNVDDDRVGEPLVVDRILDARIRYRFLNFMVRWTHGREDRTWYRPERLAFTPGAVAEYYEQYPEAPKMPLTQQLRVDGGFPAIALGDE